MLGDHYTLVVPAGVEFAEGEVKPVVSACKSSSITLLNVMNGAVRTCSTAARSSSSS